MAEKAHRIFVLWAIFWMMTLQSAFAHEWYSKRHDPVTYGACCGGSDCAKLEIQPGMLTANDDGYRLKLSAEQAAKINPYRYLAVDITIPWDRIQDSEDGNYHICLPMDDGRVRDNFFCFFAPPNT